MMPQSSFRHFAPASRIVYGDTCLDQLAPEVRRTGAQRALVFCGRTLSKSSPGLETLRAALGDLYAGAFTGVVEQSPNDSVEAGVAALRDAGADAVIALGGGSAVVTARAATILLGEGKNAEELCTVFTPGEPPKSPRLAKPKLPQFVVPTTPTTAFAKSGAAVTLPGEGRRLALFDPKARAQALFVHPGLFMATPARLIADAALDAFAQGVQGLESRKGEPLADALLLHGVRLIHRSLVAAWSTTDIDARGDLLLAAQLIGEGTDYAGAGMASALGHAIGARFPVGNGQIKSIVLPHTLRFNAAATGDRLADVAEALGRPRNDDPHAAVIDACETLFAALGLPLRLRDVGVPREALAAIATDTAQDWFLTQNPRKVDETDLLTVLEQAW